MIIGVDTGGTFTDLIHWTPAGWRAHKLLSTPDNPARAVLEGLAAIAGEARSARRVVHGSTVATNAILERKGVTTALVANQGFTDLLAIGRQSRPRLYDLHPRPEPPLAPEHLRFGVPGRILADGTEAEPFDEQTARSVARAIAASGAGSVAVCLLFAFARPEHEQRMAAVLAEEAPGLPVSLSHEILAEFREYERCSTTVINAYVSPVMNRYLAHLRDNLDPGDSLRVMQSNGGSISAATAMKEPVRTILSGPAGGVVGAEVLGRRAGFDRLITFDMGGTSTDVALIHGRAGLTLESSISGLPVKTPMIDIHTVGAGGGSIARQDAGGALKVGPQSAGADPGPACYGKGRDITVTDANLFLGRLLPDHFLGGAMALQAERVQEPMCALARGLGLEPVELAEGIIAVANAAMERAVRVISVERGHDPREFTLFSFGGAGGLHAAELARLLGSPRVMAPLNPGILSAMGMLMADVIKDYSRTVMLRAEAGQPLATSDTYALEQCLAELAAKGRQDLMDEGMPEDRIVLEQYLDMRYKGQSYEILVPLHTTGTGEPDAAETFHALHEKTYGFRNPAQDLEIVNARVRARGLPEKPDPAPAPLAGETPDPAAVLGERPVVFEGRELAAVVLDRTGLKPGNRFSGPAIVTEYSSTLLVPAWAQGRVNEYHDIILDIQG